MPRQRIAALHDARRVEHARECTLGYVRLEEANALGQAEFVARLGGVFEHSPWVAERAWRARPFSSIDHLHEAMMAAELVEALAPYVASASPSSEQMQTGLRWNVSTLTFRGMGPRPRRTPWLVGLSLAAVGVVVTLVLSGWPPRNETATGPLLPVGRSRMSTSYKAPAAVGVVKAAIKRCASRAKYKVGGKGFGPSDASTPIW